MGFAQQQGADMSVKPNVIGRRPMHRPPPNLRLAAKVENPSQFRRFMVGDTLYLIMIGT